MSQASATFGAPESSQYRNGAILVLLAGFLWSTAGIGVRMMEAADGWQVVFFRSLGLVITLLVVISMRNKGAVITPFRRVGWPGVLAGLFLGASFFCNIYALLNTSVANVLFVLSSAPFLSALLGWLVLRERVRRQTWVAIFFSTIGISVMAGGALSGNGLLGMLFALLMAIFYAAFSVAMRYGRRVDMLPATCLAGVFSMMFAAVMMDDFTLSTNDLIICLALGVGQIGLGLVAFTLGAKFVPAAELTLLSMTEVIMGPIWVWLAIGEHPGDWTLIGGSIVLFGVAFQATGARRKRVPTGIC
jgi:drug/metabolite transporter (DMT)-like permease